MAPEPKQAWQRCLAAVVLLGWALVARAGDAPPRVADPAYGEVLFHFYQRDHFGAIARLLVALEREELPHHRREAELLLGGLELSYGMWREAERVFSELLDRTDLPAEVRDRAWYQLARIAHHDGDDEAALQALGHMSERPRLRLRAERELLASQLLMRLGRPQEAVARLRRWHGPDELKPYARFNLAAALLAVGEDRQAEGKLEFLGRAKARSEEARSLRDKANLALGVRHLEAGQARDAERTLERIRLRGPFASQGLLAVGWARAEQGNLRGALVPWLELRRRDPFDPSVLEAHLAAPYAYARLGVWGKAARLYEEAIALYEEERGRLARAEAAVKNGGLAAALARLGTDALAPVPDFDPRRLPGGRYLARLLASHGFREAYRDFRDLRYMEGRLAAWADDIEVLGAMLETRRAGYARSLPRARAALAGTDLQALHARRDALAARIEVVAGSGDGLALLDAGEAAQWRRLEALEARLAILPESPEVASMREKARRLKGLLIWEAHTAFPERLWRVRRALGELDRALEALAARRAGLEQAAAAAVTDFDAYEARIGSLRSRIQSLRQRTAAARERQRERLEAMALTELRQRMERLDRYLLQSRFALAQLYDRAATGGRLRRPEAGR